MAKDLVKYKVKIQSGLFIIYLSVPSNSIIQYAEILCQFWLCDQYGNDNKDEG